MGSDALASVGGFLANETAGAEPAQLEVWGEQTLAVSCLEEVFEVSSGH
jgi:hypothetical protein